MFKEEISNEYIVMQEGTNEGTQNNFWYKKDNKGREGLSEYLVSRFMDFTS